MAFLLRAPTFIPNTTWNLVKPRPILSFICKPHNPRVLLNSSPTHMNLMSPPAPPTLVTNKHPAVGCVWGWSNLAKLVQSPVSTPHRFVVHHVEFIISEILWRCRHNAWYQWSTCLIFLVSKLHSLLPLQGIFNYLLLQYAALHQYKFFHKIVNYCHLYCCVRFVYSNCYWRCDMKIWHDTTLKYQILLPSLEVSSWSSTSILH